MLVDSHCHLDFPEFTGQIDRLLAEMAEQGVVHAICVAVNLEQWPALLDLVRPHARLSASVGVHPGYPDAAEVSPEELARLAQDPKVVAIGETGLDYYHAEGDTEWQRRRFREHIRAARLCRKPLIVYTRNAAADTLRILEEEGADRVGGVMHCFTETGEVARRALDLGFYISFSGIITFKNAVELREVVRQVPLERMLIETDAPYLAPVPHRGKTNRPAWVRHVAEEIARLKGLDLAEVAAATSRNSIKLFSLSIET